MADYGTTAGLSAYAATRGVTLSGDLAVLLHSGTLYIDSTYAGRFVGQKATWTQELQWPRINAAWPDGSAIVGIPDQLAFATYEAVTSELASSTGTIVTPSTAGVKRSRVEGAVEEEYFQDKLSRNALESSTSISTIIEGYLAGLIGSFGGLPGILVV